MAPHLQDLPGELLVQVVSYLPKSDLKSLRLTCTQYAHIGDQWLFQRVYFAPRKSAIETFLNISANPTFARTVKELVYDARLFLPELTAYKPYQEAFDIQLREECLERQCDNGNNTRDEIGGPRVSGWKKKGDQRYHESLANTMIRYTRLVDQQQSILDDKKDYEALSTGLEKFPYIAKIIIEADFSETKWSDNVDNHAWYRQRSSRENDVFIAPEGWPIQDMPATHGSRQPDARGIHTLIQAASKHCKNLKQLRINPCVQTAPITIFQVGEDVLDDACTLAKRLTCLDINLYQGTSMDDIQRPYRCLERFLSEAKELRCLTLSGRLLSPYLNLQDKVWPYLEKLVLEDLFVVGTNLRALLQAHKDTLRELRLGNAIVFPFPAWTGFAKEAGRYLQLHRITVSGLQLNESKESDHLALARSFIQWAPRAVFFREKSNHESQQHKPRYTVVACHEDGKPIAANQDWDPSIRLGYSKTYGYFYSTKDSARFLASDSAF